MTQKETISAFLRAWKDSNKSDMHKLTTKTWQSLKDENVFAATNLVTFRVLTEKRNDTTSDFTVRLNGAKHTVRLICETEPYRGDVNGVWGVYPGSFKKN